MLTPVLKIATSGDVSASSRLLADIEPIAERLGVTIIPGQPIKFADRFDRDLLFDWIAALSGQSHSPTVDMSVHMCSHSSGETTWQSCRDGTLLEYKL